MKSCACFQRTRFVGIVACALFGNALVCFAVDNPSVTSGRSDIVYLAPATQPYEAMAIGNGQLGVMVGNQAGMTFLLNHGSFFASADQNQDLMSSGQVDLSIPESWTKGFVEQRMVLHDSLVETKFATAGGAKHSIKSWLAEGSDVLIVQIDSDQPLPELTLHTWVWDRPRRPEPGLGPGPKTATWAGPSESSLDSVGLSNARATSLLIHPIDAPATAKRENDQSITLTIPAGDHKHLDILIANPCVRKNPVTADDARQAAQGIIASAQKTGLQTLREQHDSYWHDFWSKSSILMQSDDGLAEYYENLHNLFVYWMGATSRGADAPKFNGMNFLFYRDWRGWGGQYWYNNTREMYWSLPAADHPELFATLIDLYWRNLPAARKLAREMYDSPGACFEETTNGFDGGGDKRSNIGTCLYHTTGTEMACQLYQYYLYTDDDQFLREKLYPLMKEVAAFHLSFVNKEPDGLYHVYPSNPRETYHWVKDSITDQAALRTILPALIVSSKKLSIDADERAHWQDVADHLPPFTFDETTGMYRAGVLFDDYPPTRFTKVEALYPKDNGSRSKLSQQSAANVENVESDPIYPWNVWNLDSPPRELELARSTVLKRRINEVTVGNAWDPAVIWAAHLGLPDEAVKILRQFAGNVQIFPNGMYGTPGRSPEEWGKQLTDSPAFDSAGVPPTALQEMMLQSFNGRIRVYPAWPKGWRGQFTLAAQHGFVVSSSIGADGVIPTIKIVSRRGGKVDVVSPWKPGATIALDMKPGDSVDLHPDTPVAEPAPIEVKRNDGPKWPTHTPEMNTAEAYLAHSDDAGFIGITRNGQNPARNHVFKALTTDTYPTPPKVLFSARFDKSLDAEVAAGGDGKAIVSGATLSAEGADVGYGGNTHAALRFSAKGNIDPKQGTVMFWVKTSWDYDARKVKPHPSLVSIPFDDTNTKSLNIYSSMFSPLAGTAYVGMFLTDEKQHGSCYLQVGPGSEKPWLKDEWHHIAVAWNEWRVALFVDGKLILRTYLPRRLNLASSPQQMFVGCYPNVSLSPNSDLASGVVIKDLRILDQPLNEVTPPKREGTQ